MILKANNIKKSYDSNLILDELDICIKKNEIVSIKGASGSGKTTLLNILGLLDNYDGGNLFINGSKITKSSDAESIRYNSIGFIFQFHHLLEEFTVLENLLIPQLLNTKMSKKDKHKWCIELLDEINLLNLKDKFPSQISGGERQRVAFLRAIVNKPNLIIADEPTGHLDLENTTKMLNVIKNYKDKHDISFIIATHDDNVCDISDKILELKNGKLNYVKKGLSK